MLAALGLGLACQLIAGDARPAGGAVTADEVLDMMDRLPGTEMGTKPYRWRYVHDAQQIAPVIARVAVSREQAAKMIVWGGHESGFTIKAAGDCDKLPTGQIGACHSFGWLQLGDKRLPKEQAFDPEVAARTWLGLIEQSEQACAQLPEDERDAQVASGNCSYRAGRKISARRAHLLRVVLGTEAQ
jgi:hypothetical protein